MNSSLLPSRSTLTRGTISAISILSIVQLPTYAQSCTVTLLQGVLPAAVVPGTLTVDNSDTTLSSLSPGGSSGKVGLLCTQSFAANINDADVQQVPSTGQTEFSTLDANFTGAGNTTTGTILTNLLSLELTATVPNGQVIAAGDYAFVVPITITGN